MREGIRVVLTVFFAALVFTGCASIGGAPAGGVTVKADGSLDVKPEGGGIKKAITDDMADALDKLANNPLLQRADESANRTLAWVAEQEKATPPMGTLTAALARACPQAIKASTVDLREKIERLKGLLSGAGQEQGPVTGFLVFDLTRLKYGKSTGLDPKAEIEQIKADISLRMDALFTGCFHLAPKRQMIDALKLAAKLGIATQTGGVGLLLLRD